MTGALSLVAHLSPRRILDPGAGDGQWGRFARELWPAAEIKGVELREEVPAHPAYSSWTTADYLTLPAEPVHDVVLGNPPFSLGERWVRHSLAMLRDAGTLLLLFPLSLLEGQKRCRGLWRELPPWRVAILSRRPSFSADEKGTNERAFALYEWRKNVRTEPALEWLLT